MTEIVICTKDKEIDATFVGISLWNPNHFLAFTHQKNTPSIPDFLVIQKTLFIWPLGKKCHPTLAPTSGTHFQLPSSR